jgi:threonine synthase
MRGMAYVIGLRCSKCGRMYASHDRVMMCKEDAGRLNIEYDYNSMEIDRHTPLDTRSQT